MIVLYVLAAALGIEAAWVLATNLRTWRTVTATAPGLLALCTAAPEVDAASMPTATATAPRNVALRSRRRLTLALLAPTHDALSAETRRALHALELDWYVQGPRVETRRSMEAGSDLHHRVLRVLALLPCECLAEIPDGATRCWVCGCTAEFGCARGCAWWRPGQCTACAHATASVPRRPLSGGALADPPPPSASAPTLDTEERAEREGRDTPAPRWGRRRAPVVGATSFGLRRALPSPGEQARGWVIGQLDGVILPAVRARGLAVGRLVVLVGFRRDVSAALTVPLVGDPDEVMALALGRDEELGARLPSGAARRLLAELGRHRRAGLSTLWVSGARVDLVHLHHVTDATVAGRRAS